MHLWNVRRKRLAAVLMALLLAACGGQSQPARLATQRQLIDQVSISVTMPEVAQVASEQAVLVTLADAAGQPIDGAEVWLALIMPTMQMSPNEPDAQAEGGGRYRVTAIFTMSGNWNLEVHATVAGQEYIARFQQRTS
mgnify:CR=1 FL=1